MFSDGSAAEVSTATMSSPRNRSENSPSRRTMQSPAASHIINSDTEWADEFVFQWQNVLAALIEASNEGKRPKDSDRRVLVRRIADDMHEYHLNPTLSQVNSVVKKNRSNVSTVI